MSDKIIKSYAGSEAEKLQKAYVEKRRIWRDSIGLGNQIMGRGLNAAGIKGKS